MLIDRLLNPTLQASYAPWDNFWYNPPGEGVPTDAGVSVSSDRAAQISAVYAARSILSTTLAHIPLKIYRRLDRGKEVYTSHPLYRLLHDKANAIQTSMEWREQQMGELVFDGNCYSEIVYNRQRGFIAELRPKTAKRMTVVKLPAFRIGYNWRDDNGTPEPLTQDEVFHVRGYTDDGFIGISPLAAMRQSLGLTVALETFGARLFKDGANYSAVFEHPGRLSEPAYNRLKDDLKGASGWNSAHGTKILEEGLKFSKISMSADEAQFLLSRKFQISEIARWFRVPPHLLGDLEKATFSNIEQQSLEFVILTMMQWFVRWEQRINADLIFAPQTYFAEFVVDGLLRGDTATRWNAYKAAATETGALTRNEIREMEGKNPLPGLDDPLVPQNMATVGPDGKVTPINRPEAAQMDNPAQPAETPVDNEAREKAEYFKRVTSAAAARVLRKEGLAIGKALQRYGAEQDRMIKWSETFYRDHTKFVSDALCVEPVAANRFADYQRGRLLCSVRDNSAKSLISELEGAGPDYVLDLLKGVHANGHTADQFAD